MQRISGQVNASIGADTDGTEHPEVPQARTRNAHERSILLVTHYYANHRGGVELVAAALASRLAEQGHYTVTWMASDCDPGPTELTPGLTILPATSWNGIEHRIGVPWPIWSPRALLRLWKAAGCCDAIHIHDALYFGCAWAFFIAKLRRKPILVTQHVGPVPYSSSILRQIHSIANNTLARLVLSTADQTVFISEGVRSYFSNFCRFASPPRHIPNGVDTGIYFPASQERRDALRKAQRVKERQWVFLFVGRFVEKKGLATLRKLAAEFSDDVWLLAGHGPIEPESWLLPNVHVLRGLSGKTLAPLYQLADLLVLPSLSEAFPLVVQEAMACGTPAMVGADAAAGCLAAAPLLSVEPVGSPDTLDRWVTHIKRIKANPGAHEQRRPLIAEFAKTQWSWEQTTSKYAAIIETLSVR